MSTAQDEFKLAGQRLEGRYDIERVVAAGGFGVVYFGRHRALKSPVAVKVLRMPTDLSAAEQQNFAQSFLAEAQTLAALQHPAVVRAVDFGVSDMPNGKTAPWTALEWVEGQTLKDFFDARRGEPMSPREVLSLLKPVFEALASAHALGIAHRDVKPANIMLPKEGIASRILDFGIAKTMQPDEAATPTGETRTRSQLSSFSIKYAAPEQLGGMRTGPWTDVHALALVVTEALVGEAPLSGDDYVEIAASVLGAERPTPRRFGYDVGPWEEVLARALAMKAPSRFKDAKELLDALEKSVPAERPSFVSTAPQAPAQPSAPEVARPDPPLADTARPVASKPRWPVVAAAAVVSSVAVVGAVVALSGSRSAASTAGATSAAQALPQAIHAPVSPTPVVTPLPVVTPATVAAPASAITDAGASANVAPVEHRDAGRRHGTSRSRDSQPHNSGASDPIVPPV